MKPVRIIFAGFICGFVSTVHADIASVQYVDSIVSSLPVPETAADVGAVPTTRTVNSQALSADVVLTGADVAITGYTKPNATSAIAATDTVNVAVGKLEAALDEKQDKLDATANTGNIKGVDGITVTTPTTGDDAGKVVIAGPTLPTVNDNTLTIQKNGTTIDTFTANAAADKTINITMAASDVGLSNVQNVDQTNASNLTSGTVDVARLPVGTTSTTVAAGNDSRFDTISTTQPSGTPPTGTVFVWFN